MINELRSARRIDRDGEYWTLAELQRLGALSASDDIAAVTEKLSKDSPSHVRTIGGDTRLSALAALMSTNVAEAVQYFASRVNMSPEIDRSVSMRELSDRNAHILALPFRRGSEPSRFGGELQYVDVSLLIMDDESNVEYIPATRIFASAVVKDLELILDEGGCLFARVDSVALVGGGVASVPCDPEIFGDTAHRLAEHYGWGRVYTSHMVGALADTRYATA